MSHSLAPTAPTLEDFVRVALTHPTPSVVAKLQIGMEQLNRSALDALTIAIQLIFSQSQSSWHNIIPALRTLSISLGFSELELMEEAIELLFHRSDRDSIRDVIYLMAQSYGIDESTIKQIALNVQQKYSAYEPESLAVPEEVLTEAFEVETPQLSERALKFDDDEAMNLADSESKGIQMGTAIADFFNSEAINLPIRFLEDQIDEGSRDWVLRFKPALGVRVSKIRSFCEDLIVQAGIPNEEIMVQAASKDGIGWVEFFVPKSPSEWSLCYFADYQDQLVGHYVPGDELEIPIGLNYQSELSKRPLRTTLIGGMSRGGKTTEVKSIIGGMCLRYSPAVYQFCGIDPQSVMLTKFLGYPWTAYPLLLGDEAKDSEKVVKLFDWLDEQANQRERSFAEVGAETLQDFNRIVHSSDRNGLPFIHVVIEEIWLLETYIGVDLAIEKMVKLASSYSKWGIFGLFITQRPEQAVVPKLIRDNCAIRIACKVIGESSSQIILGDTRGCEAAAYLQGKGHLAVVDEAHSTPHRLQGLLITDENLAEIRDYGKREYPNYVSHSPLRKPQSGVLNLSPSKCSSEFLKPQVQLVDRDLTIDYWQDNTIDSSQDPDYEKYQILRSLEPLVRERPDLKRGELYYTEMVRRVFGLADRCELTGGTLRSYTNRIAEMKQRFGHGS